MFFLFAAPSGPPTNFTTIVVNSTRIDLAWNPPNLQQHNGILRYYLVVIRSATHSRTINVSASQFSIAINGLRPYTQYNCTVTAGTIGLGPSSIVNQIITEEDGKCLLFSKKNYTHYCVYSYICTYSKPYTSWAVNFTA